MRRTILLILAATALLSGCAFFKEARLGNSPDKAKERICLNSEGKGRFIFKGQKHVFSFQSHFSEEDLQWKTVIDFPVYGRESIEIEWDSSKGEAVYDASYEQALLENSQNLNPELLDGAMRMWTEFFEDILFSRGLVSQDTGEKISWKVTDKTLEGELEVGGRPGNIDFLNPVSEGHFGRYDFKLLSPQGEKEFGTELIVRNCMEKAD